jgi:hypothetical protein
MKYLFEAHFKDGSVIVQDEKDQSIFDPARSAYYDVMVKGKENLAFFGLASEDHTYVVDLNDGHFEVDGLPFTLQPHGQAWLIPGGTYDLIFWRDHQHDYGDTPAHRIQWRFGWWYTDPSGQKYSQTMALT